MNKFFILLVSLVFLVGSCKLSKISYDQSYKNVDQQTFLNVRSKAINQENQYKNRYFNLFWNKEAGINDPIFIDANSIIKKELKPIVKKALSYIPNELQLWFFSQGGSIVLTEQAEVLCQKLVNQEQLLYVQQYLKQFPVFNCVVLVPQDPPAFVIYVDITEFNKVFNATLKKEIANKIIKTIVRAFGLMAVEVIFAIDSINVVELDKLIKFYYGKGDEILWQDIEELAWFFIDDLFSYEREKGINLNISDFVAYIFADEEFYKTFHDTSLSQQQRYELWYDYKHYEPNYIENKKEDIRLKIKNKILYLEKFIFTEIFYNWYFNTKFKDDFLSLQRNNADFFDQVARKWNIHILPALLYVFKAVNYNKKSRTYLTEEKNGWTSKDIEGFGIFGDAYCGLARYPVLCGSFRIPFVVQKQEKFSFNYAQTNGLRTALNINNFKILWIKFPNNLIIPNYIFELCEKH